MRRSLSIAGVGLSVSAVLAVIYIHPSHVGQPDLSRCGDNSFLAGQDYVCLLVDQDTALSRLRPRFESLWGHQFPRNRQQMRLSGFCLC